jgi:hypothetical protein
MEKKLENLIKKIIFKKYPMLEDVQVVDEFEGLLNLKFMTDSSWVCRLKSEECLTDKQHMEIDREVKNLFNMLAVPSLSGIKRTMNLTNLVFEKTSISTINKF